jgi:hypothetical protein
MTKEGMERKIFLFQLFNCFFQLRHCDVILHDVMWNCLCSLSLSLLLLLLLYVQTSNSNKVKQHILEQRLNDKGGDGEKKTSCLNMEMDTTKLWNLTGVAVSVIDNTTGRWSLPPSWSHTFLLMVLCMSSVHNVSRGVRKYYKPTRCRKQMTQSQEQERRLRQTTARRPTLVYIIGT